MQTKSRTLPHSLYRKLKDDIKRRERRVLELEATLKRIAANRPEHLEQLQNELVTATESLAAAEAQIESLLKEHATRDAAEEAMRKKLHKTLVTATHFNKLSDRLELQLYTAYAIIGFVAACTAVISAVQYLPKVL